MNTLVDSNQQHKCLSALRKLLLPLSDKQELLALSAALKAAADIGIDPIDFPIFLNREQVQWQRSGAPSEELDRIVTAALSLQDDHAGKKIGRIYFPLHRDFREKTDLLLSFRDATMTLSHARLIYNLSINSNLTASQIARIVNTRDPRLNSNRKIISRLMVKLGIQHELDEVLVLNLFDSDRQDSLEIFADATVDECAALVGIKASELGSQSDLGTLLSNIASNAKICDHGPYLQMLHFQCCIAEFHDFAPKDLYEFSPRGKVFKSLVSKYPRALNATTENAFLNNAKKYEYITEAWARSAKESDFAGARALYKVLNELQAISFSARREMSFWIRCWIHRVLARADNKFTELPSSLDSAQCDRISNFIAASNTNSFGILEQRLTDAIASLKHSNDKNWISRGLEDSVNATNSSKRKLGDCDFQHIEKRQVVAYEAHGGTLTEQYFKSHMDTLKATLPLRKEQWELIGDTTGWTVKIYFLVHENKLEKNCFTEDIDGVSVSIVVQTFESTLTQVNKDELTPFINQYLLSYLKRASVPNKAREQLSLQLQ